MKQSLNICSLHNVFLIFIRKIEEILNYYKFSNWNSFVSNLQDYKKLVASCLLLPIIPDPFLILNAMNISMGCVKVRAVLHLHENFRLSLLQCLILRTHQGNRTMPVL